MVNTIRKISFLVANYLYRKNNTTHAIRYGYYYIAEMYIFQISEILLILLLALLLNCLIPVVVVLLTFIILRIKLNGFHAKTQRTCMIFSTVIICGLGLLDKIIVQALSNGLRKLIYSPTLLYAVIGIIFSITIGLVLHTDNGKIICRWIDNKLIKIIRNIKKKNKN